MLMKITVKNGGAESPAAHPLTAIQEIFPYNTGVLATKFHQNLLYKPFQRLHSWAGKIYMEINPPCQASNKCGKGLLFLTERPRDETSKAVQTHIQIAM